MTTRGPKFLCMERMGIKIMLKQGPNMISAHQKNRWREEQKAQNVQRIYCVFDKKTTFLWIRVNPLQMSFPVEISNPSVPFFCSIIGLPNEQRGFTQSSKKTSYDTTRTLLTSKQAGFQPKPAFW